MTRPESLDFYHSKVSKGVSVLPYPIGWPDIDEGACLTFFPILLIKSGVGNLWNLSLNVIYVGPQASEVRHFRGILREVMILNVLGTWVRKISGSYLRVFYFRNDE